MHALVDWLASALAPWSDLYVDHAGVEAAVMFLHLGGVVAAGGLAFTLDRAVLRSHRHGWPRRTHLARELHLAHGAVLGGLAVVLLSGVALTAADPTIFLLSWIYWAKMGVVVVLLANGWLLKRSGARLLTAPDDEGAFRKLRRAALRSAGLWAVSLAAGVAITLYA